MLYYSVLATEEILPDVYWNHYALLVEALSSKITKEELNCAKQCLNEFYEKFSELCGINYFFVGLNNNLVKKRINALGLSIYQYFLTGLYMIFLQI